jgi:MFS family permease
MSCRSSKVALSSAPWLVPHSLVRLVRRPHRTLVDSYIICGAATIGRRFSLIAFTLVFCVGAILTTVAGPGNKGLNEIYIGEHTENAANLLILSRKHPMLLTGRVISGLGIGGISAIAPTYVSECAPKDVRGRITGLFQVFVAIGVMISYWTNCKLLF